MLLFLGGMFVGAAMGVFLIAVVKANEEDDDLSRGHPA